MDQVMQKIEARAQMDLTARRRLRKLRRFQQLTRKGHLLELELGQAPEGFQIESEQPDLIGIEEGELSPEELVAAYQERGSSPFYYTGDQHDDNVGDMAHVEWL